MRATDLAGCLTATLLLAGCGKPVAPKEAGAVQAESAPAAGLSEAAKKAALASLPPAYQNADFDNGQAKFALCKSCHTVSEGGAAMTGPNLWGVFGRKAGASPGYAYSDGLKALAVTWDADQVDRWISNPRKMVPGTKMTYLGMENPKDRIDLVAYLKAVTSPPPAG